MKNPLNKLLEGGKQLLAKVRLHYQQDPRTLPPEQQVTVAELNAWYRGVETALERAFGTDSHELKTWHFRMQEIKKQDWENIASRTDPLVVSRLENTLGILEELRVATTAFDQSSGEVIEPEQLIGIRDEIHQLLQREEGSQLEFKAALRWDHIQNAVDSKLERRVLCSVSAFANGCGGTLLIGVDPQKQIIGLRNDFASLKGNQDEFERHLRQLISAKCGKVFNVSFLQISFQQGICRIDVAASNEAVFLKWDGEEEFWVRNGNANLLLKGKDLTGYVQKRFSK